MHIIQTSNIVQNQWMDTSRAARPLQLTETGPCSERFRMLGPTSCNHSWLIGILFNNL